MNRASGRGEGGFTLIEIMMTTAIVAIGMVMVMGAMVAIIGSSSKLDMKTIASNHTHSILELVRLNDLLSILSFEIPLNPDEEGFANVPGLGLVEITMKANLGDGNFFIFGQTDPATVDSAPNPIEVIVEFRVVDEQRRLRLFQSSSALISYL